MSTGVKILIVLAGLAVLGGLFAANMDWKGGAGSSVTVEKIQKRDIESLVSASGRVRAKVRVEISANTTGPIQSIPVKVKNAVKKGDLLCRIDPKEIRTAITKAETAVADADKRLSISRKLRDKAKLDLDRIKNVLTTPPKALDEAVSALSIREDEVSGAELFLKTAGTELERAQHELTKVDIVSPQDGVVTDVNREVGEMVYGGAFGGNGTVILVVSDLSEMQVELEVDETDVVLVKEGQEAKVAIDAWPDRKFKGEVTEVAASPKEAAAGQTRSAVAFEVVVKLIEVPDVIYSGMSATAEIVAARREQAVAVPIQALNGREYAVNEAGEIVRGADAPKDLKRKELEGVFQIVDGKARFKPVEVGIMGEKYYEVLKGLEPDEEVVTGPHTILRDLKDDAAVTPKK